MPTVHLISPDSRSAAHALIREAQNGWIVTVEPPRRTKTQNRQLWAMLNEVSRAAPGGRNWTPTAWKAVFMSALGIELSMVPGLYGEPVPIDLSSSRLSVRQMNDLITLIECWMAENGVSTINGQEAKNHKGIQS